MPDGPPDNDLFDYPPPLSPDEIAFLEDFKAYDNPEVYRDASLPQVFKLRLINILLPNSPTIISER